MKIRNAFLLLFILTALHSICQEFNPDSESTFYIEDEPFTSGIEGPAVDENGNLYVVNYKKEGTIAKIDTFKNVTTYLTLPSGSIGNGIRFLNGKMYVADYKGHNIIQVTEELDNTFQFKKINNNFMTQPNDLAINKDGRIFMSDPNWSSSTGRVWAVQPNDTITLLDTNLGTTNGIEVSTNEKYLYVNERVQRNVWKYTIVTDNEGKVSITNKTLFHKFTTGGMDGMRCDIKGNLYITRTGVGTVAVLDTNGQLIHEVTLKGKNPTNIAFGSCENSRAYITVKNPNNIETFNPSVKGRSCLFFNDLLGVNTYESGNNVTIHPMPFDEHLWIDYPQDMTIQKGFIFNTVGGLVLEINPTKIIDTKTLLPGNYVLKLVTDNGVLIKKLVKQ